MSALLRASTRGRLAALGSAASFSAVATFAGLAYANGAVPEAVIYARLLLGFAVTWLAVLVLKRPWSMPRREWKPTLAVLLGWLTVSVAYMASFYFIPVSLAVLFFFTFPVQIALIEPLTERRRPDAVTLAAALIAFAGLALAVGPEFAGLDWRGCVLAALAGVGVTTTFLMSRRLVHEQDMFTLSFHLHWLCLPLLLAYAIATGGITLPASLVALGALAGVGVFYATAVLLQFAAIRWAGPARSAIVFNVEPIITILGAAIVLGEALSLAQAVGAALVIAGVLLSTRTSG